MKTNLKLIKISLDEMIDNSNGDYNISTWNQRVKRYFSDYKNVQFYFVEKGNGYDYVRFFVSYIIPEGLYLFSEFKPFSGCLSNNGFCKVTIGNDGFLHKHLFFNHEKNTEGYAENCKQNRKMFAEKLTPLNIMVSNCI